MFGSVNHQPENRNHIKHIYNYHMSVNCWSILVAFFNMQVLPMPCRHGKWQVQQAGMQWSNSNLWNLISHKAEVLSSNPGGVCNIFWPFTFVAFSHQCEFTHTRVLVRQRNICIISLLCQWECRSTHCYKETGISQPY